MSQEVSATIFFIIDSTYFPRHTLEEIFSCLILKGQVTIIR